MPNKDDSCGRRRFIGPCLMLLLSLAGCESFPQRSADAPAPPSPIAVAPTPELTPVAVPYIPFQAPIVAPDDLLGRIRKELRLPPSDDPAVQREVAWYARNQPYIERVFQRSERYLFHIVEALQARNMPTDLALLPVVESAFDPFAYSHGRASGLWQIIPGTGKRLGLRQNWWFDGRRDVLESTRAALDYLAAPAGAVRRRLAARHRRLQLGRRQRRARHPPRPSRRPRHRFLGYSALPTRRDSHLCAAAARDPGASR